MASIMHEYLRRNLSLSALQDELQSLISKYNKHTGRTLFIYASDLNKRGIKEIDLQMMQDDFYDIQDILRQETFKKIDVYIQSPGGSGETAEEIARFLHNKFEEVNFVIASEAKSAATILVMSGHNIYMTETGSLGPTDAQVVMGRSRVSAHDYKEWIDEKREEAARTGKLNPFDAIMIAQITPGEIKGVLNSLEYAKVLVTSWLQEYKFKNWTHKKSTGEEVTPQMKEERARKVAEYLCDHTKWRTHGRSLKIEDISDDLIIERIDDDDVLADIVYRIKTVLRFIFDAMSPNPDGSFNTIYKLYYLHDFKLHKTFSTAPVRQQQGRPVEQIQIDFSCPACNAAQKVNAFLGIDSKDIAKLGLKPDKNLKDGLTFVCNNCKADVNLAQLKAQVEGQIKKPITFK